MAGAVNSSGAGRDPVIDVARGMAIVLVVVGHNRALSSAAPAMIDALFLFHVPLFFLLSGWVQREQPMPAAARGLARRLLLPFALAGMLVGTVKVVTREGSFGDLLIGMGWATGQTLPWSHLWFLPALFLALLGTQLLRRAPGGVARWPVAVLVAGVTVAFAPMVTGPDLGAHGFPAPTGWPWSVDLLPYCLLFVWLGAWLNESPRFRAAILSPWAGAVAVVAFCLALRARVDLNLREFTPAALAAVAAISGCILALFVARAVALVHAPRRLLATVGRHTLAIFLLHVSIQKVLLGGSTSWVAGALAAVAAIGISMAVSFFAQAAWVRWQDRRARLTPPAREVAT